MSYIASDPYAWELCRTLVYEVAEAAAAEGVRIDAEKAIGNARAASLGNPGGMTSIAADIAAGRRTECDYITGYVVRSAEKHGVPVPVQRTVYRIIKALEGR